MNPLYHIAVISQLLEIIRLIDEIILLANKKKPTPKKTEIQIHSNKIITWN